jgi:hypothetical protein
MIFCTFSDYTGCGLYLHILSRCFFTYIMTNIDFIGCLYKLALRELTSSMSSQLAEGFPPCLHEVITYEHNASLSCTSMILVTTRSVNQSVPPSPHPPASFHASNLQALGKKRHVEIFPISSWCRRVRRQGNPVRMSLYLFLSLFFPVACPSIQPILPHQMQSLFGFLFEGIRCLQVHSLYH